MYLFEMNMIKICIRWSWKINKKLESFCLLIRIYDRYDMIVYLDVFDYNMIENKKNEKECNIYSWKTEKQNKMCLHKQTNNFIARKCAWNLFSHEFSLIKQIMIPIKDPLRFTFMFRK